MADPVGVREIAERLGASRKTVWKWTNQGIFPDAEYPAVNTFPAWEWETVLRWVGDSRRLHHPPARVEYKRRFGQEAPAFRPAGPMTDEVAAFNAETLARKTKVAKAAKAAAQRQARPTKPKAARVRKPAAKITA